VGGTTTQGVLVREWVECNSSSGADRYARNWDRKDAGVEMEMSEMRKKTRTEREVELEIAYGSEMWRGQNMLPEAAA